MSTPPRADSEPLRRGLAWRLVLVWLAALAALSTAVLVITDRANQRAAELQLRDAVDFIEQRQRAIDSSWLAQADILRAQLEFSRVLDGQNADERAAKITAFMAILGGEGPFTHLLLVDAAGNVVYRYRTRSQQDMTPPADPGSVSWAFGQNDRTVYRAISQRVLLGGSQAGRMLLFTPADNALLESNIYPETTLVLRWAGEAMAQATGRPASASTATDDGSPHWFSGDLLPSLSVMTRWNGQPDGPEILITRSIREPLGRAPALVIAALGALGVALLGWLVLGRWLAGHAGRLGLLQSATATFSKTQTLTPEIATALGSATEGGPSELRQLINEVRQMMGSVEQSRQDLVEVNEHLEERVEKRTQDLVLARDEALAASRMKEQFLTNMSHELRTPLSGMLGSLELLEGAALEPKHAMLLQISRSSGSALLGIINELLDFAKIEAGQLNLVNEPLSPQALVDEVVQLFWASASRKGISLQGASDGLAAGLQVLGDLARLRQVLMNLTGNAVKFTERGEVTVRVRALTTSPHALRLRFEVQDTGIGVGVVDQAKVFMPFVQAAERQAGGGTGLGLTISQRIVSAMGGQINLQSEPGAGTVFFFELDMAVVTATELAAPEASAAHARSLESEPDTSAEERTLLRGRVMLVDDNLVNRIVGSEMLKRLGLEVLECEDGLQACEQIEREPVDLVLMDCLMPVLDGYAATQRIRQWEADKGGAQGRPRVPVIAITANALAADIARCHEVGMDDHLPKPFTQRQLEQSLSKWLPRAAVAGPAL